MGLLEAAAATLSNAERKIEIAARNVSNVKTPGYKREVAFAEIVDSATSRPAASVLTPAIESTRVLGQSTLTESGSAMDLAIDGQAFVLVRQGDRLLPSRGGQFRLTRDGALSDAEGRILQQIGGGDLVVESENVVVNSDGTVFADDVPAGAIGLYAVDQLTGSEMQDGLPLAGVAALGQSESAQLRQGMLESSNVVLSDEMVALMQAQRMAEAGAQLVRAYDQLIGQATSTFNRGGK